MKVNTDIDIDVSDRDEILSRLPHIAARIDREDGYVKHNTGVYFQAAPRDPVTNICTLDYKLAEELGYLKVDLLNNSIYNNVRDEEHLQQLVKDEPMWRMLEDGDIVKNLFHIGQHSELVTRLKPKSIDQLAMILAIIRPGKAYLQDKNWEEIEKDVWVKPQDGKYFFKKSHSYAFALAIVVQMNLLVEQALVL